MIKFTGDGWLVITPDTAKLVPNMCCLALIMSQRFAEEMSEAAELDRQKIPNLRLSIDSGVDIGVELPNGQKDWVGDSVRKAVRACGYCLENEVLVGPSAFNWASRDFESQYIQWSELQTRPVKKQSEDPLDVYRLDRITENPGKLPAYGYTLRVLGLANEAQKVFVRVTEELEREAVPAGAAGRGRSMLSEPHLVKWNRLIAAQTYGDAKATMERMEGKGIQPDVVTYTTLLNLAKDYTEGEKILGRMEKEGIQPNVVTYNTLLNLAKDYAEGEKILGRMEEKKIQPDVVTYTTLLNLAENYAEGEKILGRMEKEGIQPNVVTYTTLFSKDVGDRTAEEILTWFVGQEHHPEAAIGALFANYRKTRREDQMLRIALSYPHHQAVIPFIHENGHKAIAYFEGVRAQDPNHPNAAYALGIALMEADHGEEAIPCLEDALELATSEGRKRDIRKRLGQLRRE